MNENRNDEIDEIDEKEFYYCPSRDVFLDAKIVDALRKIENKAVIRGAIYAAVGFFVGQIIAHFI